MAVVRGVTRRVAWVRGYRCLALLALWGSGSWLWAQSANDGAIGGRVLSAAGRPVEGALIVARDVETGLAINARSGAQGDFLVVRLPPGNYAVTVEETSVELTLAGPITVALGEVTEVEAWMRPPIPGAVEQQASPGTELESAAVNEADLGQLPIDGGQWRGLAFQAPDANVALDSDESAAELSFRGVSVAENASRTDGTSGDESFSGMAAGAGVEEDADAGADVVSDKAAGVGSGSSSVNDGGRRAGSAYTLSQASVREFRVQGQGDAASYGSALYGHGVGGVVTAVTRSGGTRLHGMAFYTVRDSVWAAANPFSLASTYANGVVTNTWVKPTDLRQQFGGNVGGPLLTVTGRGSPERVSYFYAFDAQRRSFPAVSSPGYAGFYTLTATQAALLSNRGVSPAKTMVALNYLNSLTGTVPRRADQTVNFVRLDWRRPGGSQVALEYNRAGWSNPGGARSSAVVDRGLASIGNSFGAVDMGVARWVQFLHRGLSNELRVQYGEQLQYETAQTPLPQEPGVGPGGMAPEVSIGPNGLVFGTPAALGQKAYPDERRLEAANVVVWTHGRQLFQLGGDFSAISDYTDSLTNVEGTFSYDSGATGGKAGGLVDWITDYTYNVKAYPNGACPSITAAIHDFCFRSYSQSFGQQSLQFSRNEWAGFVQDDWRVRPSLTLHAGLRYEYESVPAAQQPNPELDAVFGGVGATSSHPEDRNNFGPRLGFAWDPFGTGRGTIRIGYGLYFGKLPGATVRAALLDTALPSSVTRIRILPTTETLCPQATTVGFGYACSYLAAPAGVVAATTSAVVFDHRFRLPAVQQGTLSLERHVPWGIVATAGYTLNLDRQLPNSVDINIGPSTGLKEFQLEGGTGAVGVRDGETFVVPAYSERINTAFGPVTDIVSNANATYNGLTVQARRGLGGRAGMGGVGRGLEFRAAWTWSKAIDFGQNSGATPRTNGQFDPFNVRYDKGLSALDFPQRIVGTAVWSPRLAGVLAGERTLWKAANGWSLAGIFSRSSGRVYSYDISGGTRLTGGRESINGSGGSVVLPTIGRNTLRLPDTTNLDLRLSRGFRLGSLLTREGLRLHVSAEAFNVLNHLNYSGIQQRAFLVGTPVNGITPLVFQNAATVASEGLNVQPFGTYTAAGTSQARERQVQFGVKVEF